MMARVLSVGQCGFDHASIAVRLRLGFGATVVGVGNRAAAIEALRGGGFDLVLVNRVFDEDGTAGLELIRDLKADPALAGVPVMLVSNFPDPQRAAESLGALPGFGKAEMSTPTARERLASVLTPAPE